MLNRVRNTTDSVHELATIYIFAACIVAVLFMLFENKSLAESFWWTFVTGLTIGYGDIYPHTLAGQILAVLWAHLTVFFLVPVAIGHIIMKMVKNENEFTDSEQRQIKSDLRAIKRHLGVK